MRVSESVCVGERACVRERGCECVCEKERETRGYKSKYNSQSRTFSSDAPGIFNKVELDRSKVPLDSMYV